MRIALRKIFCPQYLYRLHKQAVLNSLDAFMQGFFRVSWLNSNLFAADDGAGINFRGYVVDRTAGYFHASVEGLSDGMESTKDGNGGTVFCGVRTACPIIRYKGGMQVDDTPGELCEKGGAENTHPASQDNEINTKEA